VDCNKNSRLNCGFDACDASVQSNVFDCTWSRELMLMFKLN